MKRSHYTFEGAPDKYIYPEAGRKGSLSWLSTRFFNIYPRFCYTKWYQKNCVTWEKFNFLIKPFLVFLIFSTQEKIELKLQRHSSLLTMYSYLSQKLNCYVNKSKKKCQQKWECPAFNHANDIAWFQFTVL